MTPRTQWRDVVVRRTSRRPGRATRRSAALAWWLFVVSNVAHAAGWVLVVLSEEDILLLDLTVGAVLVLLTAVGALLAWRRPGNVIGWLFSAAGAVLAATNLTYGWAALAAERDLPGGIVAAWLTSWLYLPGLLGLPPLLFLLFPDGRPLSRRWRWVVGLTTTALVAVPAGQALAPGPLSDSPMPLRDNPYAVPAVAAVAMQFGWTLLLVSIVLAGWSLVLRYRRATGVSRTQLRWVALAAALFVLGSAVSAALRLTPWSEIGPVLVVTALATFPLAAGVSILRYRLYDIDLVVNRALVYGSLTAALAAVYLVCVLLLQILLGPVTRSSDLAVAVSTLTVAAMFGPARRRLQAAVDQRFFRRRYDAARTVSSFADRLRREVDLEEVSRDLTSAVRDTVAPSHVSLWVRGVI